MRDVLMLVLIAAFFALCIAYVAWCDRIIGPDPVELGAAGGSDARANEIAGVPNNALDSVPGDVRVP